MAAFPVFGNMNTNNPETKNKCIVTTNLSIKKLASFTIYS